MADRRHPEYDSNAYGAYGSQARSGRSDRDAYASGDGYGADAAGSQGRYGEPSSPYGDAGSYGSAYDDPYAGQRSSGRAGRQSPYGNQGGSRQSGRYGSDPYGTASGSSSSGSQRSGRATQYPVGSGQAYTSSRRPNNAAGVTPVSATSYHRQGGYTPSGNLTPQHNGSGVSRRNLLKIAGGGIVAAAVLGVAGAMWYTHRAVACTIDGKVRELPVGVSVQEIVNRGYASPVSGNLVSICEEGEVPEVLEKGAGNPYTLCVNGEPVDVAEYRLKEGDILEFINGTDRTEDVNAQNTEIPCGIQVPDSSLLLASVGYVKQWGRNGISTVETGVVSGRVIDRGVTQEAQDLIIANSGVNPDDGRRLVALTFDDGPHLDYTPQYLDILARYGAKATFFMLGQTLESAGEEYVQMAQRVRDAGHQIASHTYSHDDRTLSGLDAAGREAEISQAFDAIEQALGIQTSVMRPPYGEFRGWQFLQYMAQTGRDITASVYWSVDSEDWKVAETTGVEDGAALIVEKCTTGLSGDNYNGAIILMHDAGGNRERDVLALPTIIERFQTEGYELVTLNELFASDSTLPEWMSSGNAVRPADSVIPDTSAYF